ncbi:MAG: hypothetical protein AB7G20_03465 [Sulfurimonas sp.]|uniref:hypothetical protein n=1 Tax=Sulfurimonas sp. TaxID=2022749 RepID=UPI003D138D3A
MTFLKALFLALVVTLTLFIIVYIHIVIALSIYNLARYKVKEKKNPFLYGWEYKGKSVLKLFASIFILLHFLLFIDYYRSYINEKTKYHDAKVYYVVGMIPHTYSVLLGRFFTPLNPLFLSITKPTNAMKEYLFEKGIQHIPNTDGERELWEYEWFFYPYAIRFSDMYDKYYMKRLYPTAQISKGTYDYLYKRSERLYEIIEALNTKKIADLYREADSIKKIPLMAYYYREKAQWLSQPTPTNIISEVEKMKIWEESGALERKIKEWLQALPNRMDYQMQFQEWGNTNLKALLKVEATRQFIVLRLMQDELYREIYANKFHCNNETSRDYINLRNRFIMGGKNSILDRWSNIGGSKEAYILQGDFKDDSNSDFFRVILKKYCSVEVLGISKYASEFHEKNILDPNKKIIKILETGDIK